MKNYIKTGLSLLLFVFFIILSIGSSDDSSSKSSDKNKSNKIQNNDVKKKNGPGNSSCRYEVEKRIESIGGMHTGIEHKGDGMFMAFVASSTTNYEYKVIYFYTDSDCEIINVKVQ